MKSLLGAALACLALQEGPPLSRLGDDSPAVREGATAALVRAGRAAEGGLRRALGDRDPEVRARAAHVLGEMERLERGREFEPGPSLITIERADATLRDVVAEIRVQSRTSIALPRELEDRRVSASFDRPVGEAGAAREADGLSVRILYCQHERTRVGSRVEIRPPRAASQVEVRLVDGQGRCYVPEVGRDDGDGQAAGLQLEFTLPAGEEVAALRFEAPRALREKRVPFELRDLPVR